MSLRNSVHFSTKEYIPLYPAKVHSEALNHLLIHIPTRLIFKILQISCLCREHAIKMVHCVLKFQVKFII